MTIRRFILLAPFIIPACAAAQPRPPAHLFDDWFRGTTTTGINKTFIHSESTTGNYSITLLKADEDQDDFILIGRQTETAKETILGYGERGAEVHWFPTKAGEFAIIDNQTDNGTNELFIIGPLGATQKDPWPLCYKTPENFGRPHVVAHCYWSIVNLDPDTGMLTLKASWDFSDVTNAERQKLKTEGVYNIPLFYGSK